MIFVSLNVICGFVLGSIKTSFRSFTTKVNSRSYSSKESIYNYDNILALALLESMRAINVTRVNDDIATFEWENIPIVTQVRSISIYTGISGPHDQARPRTTEHDGA